MQFRRPHTLLFGLTAASCSLAPALSAQATFGVTAGIVSANVAESVPPSPTVSKRSKTGFAGGITLSYAFSKAFAFAPEVLYVQKGYDHHQGQSGDFAPYEEIAAFDYVEVPLLFRLRFGGRERMFFLLGGPSVSFLVSCSLQDLTGSRVDDITCQLNGTTPFTSSTDVGGMFGAGLSYRRFTLSVRDDIGFANILSSKFQAEQPGSTFKNRALSLMVGFTLGR